jgi:thymidylate synthase (FAD)
MQVELLDSAGGDLSIVNSARVSFAKVAEEVGDKDVKLIKYLAKHKHMTPFRHNFIQLRCKVPVFLARQLMKHQAGLSWNEVSRRYVDSGIEIYSPDTWRERPDSSIKQGSGDELKENANARVKRLYEQHMAEAVRFFEILIAEKVSPEMARMVLPQSMQVEFIWSGNLLAFAHVYNLRAGDGAQKEAQDFAQLLHEAIAPAFPVGWEALTNE